MESQFRVCDLARKRRAAWLFAAAIVLTASLSIWVGWGLQQYVPATLLTFPVVGAIQEFTMSRDIPSRFLKALTYRSWRRCHLTLWGVATAAIFGAGMIAYRLGVAFNSLWIFLVVYLGLGVGLAELFGYALRRVAEIPDIQQDLNDFCRQRSPERNIRPR